MEKVRKHKAYVILGSILLMLTIGIFISEGILEGEIKKTLDSKIGQASMFVDIKYDDVSASVVSKEYTVSGVEIKPKIRMVGASDVKIGSITVSTYLTEIEYMDDFFIEVNDLEFKVPKDSRQFRRAFGDASSLIIDEVRADLRFEYEVSGNELEGRFFIEIDDIGSFESELELSSAKKTIENISNMSSRMIMGVLNSPMRRLDTIIGDEKLEKLDINIENDGAYEIAVASMSKREGLTVAELTEEMVQFFEAELRKATKAREPVSISVLTSILEFIDDPDTFEISVRPGSKNTIGEFFQELRESVITSSEPGFKVTASN